MNLLDFLKTPIKSVAPTIAQPKPVVSPFSFISKPVSDASNTSAKTSFSFSFSDTNPAVKTNTSTPAVAKPGTVSAFGGETTIRPAFAKDTEARPMEGGALANIGYNFVARAEELIPKVAVQFLANISPKQSVKLPIDASRLGLPSDPDVQSTGVKAQADFQSRQVKNNPTNNIYKTWGNAVISSLVHPVMDALDIFGAEGIVAGGAEAALKNTGYDPALNQALDQLGLRGKSVTIEDLKTSFYKRAENIIEHHGGEVDLSGKAHVPQSAVSELNQLGGATQKVAQSLTGKGVPQLSKFGEAVQNTARLLTEDVNTRLINSRYSPLGEHGVEAPEALPGYRSANPNLRPVGLSTEPLEPVGNFLKKPVSEVNAKPPVFQGNTDLTTKVLEKLKGRDVVSKQFISDLINAPDLKQTERDLIRNVLTEFPDGKNIPVQEFADKVKSELLPLKVRGMNDDTLSRKKEIVALNKEIQKVTGEDPQLAEYKAFVKNNPDGYSKSTLDKLQRLGELQDQIEKGVDPYFGTNPSKYENITLPDELRGNVANYKENIYESPVKTSAGDTHFPDSGTKNYFGHTRVEDMADSEEILRNLKGRKAANIIDNAPPKGSLSETGGTRRVIELQSDLYQKGNLEREGLNARKIANGNWAVFDKSQNLVNEFKGRTEAEAKAFASEPIKKLQQYSNPTAHFRMAREEIKQAAIDGKTKLQFPTGETAMKIEGLGQGESNMFSHQVEGQGRPYPVLTPDKLKVGETILQHDQNPWIITDVLVDGKFKAVPSDIYELKNHIDAPVRNGRITLTKAEYEQKLNSFSETFDISGKVDTNNPIYKFYEKDLGRYLKNNFGAKLITDDRGVSWYEVPIKKSQGLSPVTAFTKDINNGNINDNEKTFNTNRVAAEENGYGTNSKNSQNPREKGFWYEKFTGRKSTEFDRNSGDRRRLGAGNQGISRPLDLSDLIAKQHSVINPKVKLDLAISYMEDNGVPKSTTSRFKEIFNALPKELQDKYDGVVHLRRQIAQFAIDKSDTWQLGINPEYFNTPTYDKGRVIDHEIGGHLTYFASPGYQKVMINDGVRSLVDNPLFEKIIIGSRTNQDFQRIISLYSNETLKVLLNGLQDSEVGDLDHDEAIKILEASNKGIAEAASKGDIPSILESKNKLRDFIKENNSELYDRMKVFLENESNYLSNEIFSRTIEYASEHGLDLPGRFGQLVKNLSRGVMPELDSSTFKTPGSIAIGADEPSEKVSASEYQTREEPPEGISSPASSPAKYRSDEEIDRPYNERLPHDENYVKPPTVRGGITPPEIDFTKLKDKAAISLSRETMERNIEKIAGPQASAINQFLIEPLRLNESARIEFTNSERAEIKQKMEDLGIKMGSKEDALVQKLGEKNITLDELKAATPKWKEVQEASSYFRNKYDQYLNKINSVREAHGYNPIPKRPDYFRHFEELNRFIDTFGISFKNGQLPTTLAGQTEFFNPGKPFTTAELKRKGGAYTESAIKGADRYLDATSNQIFHTDTVQRGRALEKYIRQSAEKNPDIKLPNFVSNLHEWTNKVAGKTAALDRAIENVVGRPLIKVLEKIKSRFGANVINANISSAITHAIPVSFNLASVSKPAAVRGLIDTMMSAFVDDTKFSNVDGVQSGFLLRRFPTKQIFKTGIQKVGNTMGLIFKGVDRFISRLAVTSKYFEGISKGLSKEEAMKAADNYAQRVIGDRSIGNLPNIMNTKTLGFLTQFQIEVNDNISFLMHDMPRQAKAETQSKTGAAFRLGSMLIQFAVFSFLFNQFMKKLKGSGKGLDPIDITETLLGTNAEGNGQPFGARVTSAGKDLAEELPGGSLLGGQFPVMEGLPDIASALSGKTSWATELKKLAYGFLSPVGGGTQFKKTFEGIQALMRGYSANSKGNPQFTVSPEDTVKTVLFGKSSLPQAQEYYSGVGKPDPETQKVQKLYDQAKALYSSGDKQGAQAIINSLSPDDQKIFKSLKTKEVRTQTNAKVQDMYPTAVKAKALTTKGDTAGAKALYNSLSDDDKKLFATAYKNLYPNGNASTTPSVPNGTQLSHDNLIDTIVTYAKAIGADPLTAFNRIFSGQKILRVDNGAVIVERLPFADSQAIKADQNGKNPSMKLDHTIPLELGGSNDKSNLKLVTTEEWNSYTPVENYLGEQLRNGEMSKKEVQDLIVKFKSGQLKAGDIIKS